jgi:pyridoxal phosphate enzyme (YggS family)
LKIAYEQIRAQINQACQLAARDPKSVSLVAVSKNQPFEKIKSLYDLGHRDFGENYVQELLTKAQTAKNIGLEDIRWHFIGHLQSNKVKLAVQWITMIHSVDSLKLAQEISKRALQPIPILLEVNLDDEPTKSGFNISELTASAHEIAQMHNLILGGLMCIPNPAATQDPFKRLAELEKSLRPLTQGLLSMGMSGDFDRAIAAGATHIRIGTALFGARQ